MWPYWLLFLAPATLALSQLRPVKVIYRTGAIWPGKRVIGTQAERNLWTLMALAALVTVAVLLVSPSSTAVDRVALYLIPLQLFVFARLPDMLGQGTKRRTWVLAVLGYYAVVLFVWLTFATHSRYWLPYQFYPLVGL